METIKCRKCVCVCVLSTEPTKERHENKDEQWPWLSKTYAMQFQSKISVKSKIQIRMVRFLAFDAIYQH